MTVNMRVSLPTRTTTALAFLVCIVLTPASAQTPAPGDQPRSALPDGFSVTPPLPVPRALVPESGRGGTEASPEGEREPGGMPHGGCRYQDQKLDLIV